MLFCNGMLILRWTTIHSFIVVSIARTHTHKQIKTTYKTEHVWNIFNDYIVSIIITWAAYSNPHAWYTRKHIVQMVNNEMKMIFTHAKQIRNSKNCIRYERSEGCEENVS